MKAPGIVRRIDDLGRVVIPKEIRRTMRIREGDPLEIFTDHEGEVIFKKYSPIGELSAFAIQYADTLSRVCDMAVVICDRDSIIACGGLPKKEFMELRLSSEAEHLIEARTLHTHTEGAAFSGIADSITHWQISCLMPILAEGDVVGCVASLTDTDRSATDTEQKLIETAATFLGKQLES